MVRHLVQHSLINDSQHGFIPKRVCLTNLIELLDYDTLLMLLIMESLLMLFASIPKGFR